MKVEVGMKVAGDIDVGIVVAMSRDWCIYQPMSGEEVAEPWAAISICHGGPSETISSVASAEAGIGRAHE